MISYNRYLYNLRKEKGLTRAEASKASGVSAHFLRLYEEGFRIPSFRHLEKLSLYYEDDLIERFFYEDISFPEPLEDPLSSGSSKSHKKPGIIHILLIALSALILWFGFSYRNRLDREGKNYGPKYRQLINLVRDRGTFTTNYYKAEMLREISDADDHSFAEISVDFAGLYYDSSFISVLRNRDGFRVITCQFGYDNSRDDIYLTAVTDDGLLVTAGGKYYGGKKADILELTVSAGSSDHKDIMIDSETLADAVGEASENMDRMLGNRLGSDTTLYEILSERELGASTDRRLNFLSYLFIYGGIILLGILLSEFFYKLFRNVIPGDIYYVSLKHRKRQELRSDIHFGPFIIESYMLVIALLLLLFSLVRFLSSAVAATGVLETIGITADNLTSIGTNAFYIGMFLMSLTQMDIFISDRQLIRNLIYCLGAYITIYALEAFTYSFFVNIGASVLSSMSENIPGNIFGVNAMEYLCALFLFFTPEFLKKNRVLTVLWRICSVIPMLVVFYIYIVGNAYSVIFFEEPSPYFRLLVPPRYFPLAIITFLVIYITYFMRVYYARKYGVRRAKFYLDSNSFQMTKNMFVCSLIVIMAAAEYLLQNNEYAKIIGFNGNYSIIFTVPLLLFYHRHIGRRNKAFDRITRYAYYIIINSYVAVTALKLIVIFYLTYN
ncbi:MAG: helix-turn-helix transcriptional regulator [Solobacterium sp.]|nr:helix-turn-helix transcriptional regulator [Solobacterium sp.]